MFDKSPLNPLLNVPLAEKALLELENIPGLASGYLHVDGMNCAIGHLLAVAEVPEAAFGDFEVEMTRLDPEFRAYVLSKIYPEGIPARYTEDRILDILEPSLIVGALYGMDTAVADEITYENDRLLKEDRVDKLRERLIDLIAESKHAINSQR